MPSRTKTQCPLAQNLPFLPTLLKRWLQRDSFPYSVVEFSINTKRSQSPNQICRFHLVIWVYKRHLIEWGEAIYGIQPLAPCDLKDQIEAGAFSCWAFTFALSFLHCIIRRKPRTSTVWDPSTDFPSHTPACPPQPLHWGHFSKFPLQEQPCPWSKKQAQPLTVCRQSREVPKFSTAGQQHKLTAGWDNSLSPYGTQSKDWSICWYASQFVTQAIKSFLHDAGISPFLQVRQSEATHRELVHESKWNLRFKVKLRSIYLLVQSHTYSETSIYFYKPMNTWQSLTSNSMPSILCIWSFKHITINTHIMKYLTPY